MATRQVYSVKELQVKLAGITNEISALLNEFGVIHKNTQSDLSNEKVLPGYAYTKLQMDGLYTLLNNVSSEFATIVADPDYFVYPYLWQPGVTGALTSFDLTATTITAKTDFPSAVAIDIFGGLTIGDFIKISNAAQAANDGYWEVLSQAAGVLTITGGTLNITTTPDTTMTIELVLAET